MSWDETDWKRLERMLNIKQDKETCVALREATVKAIDKMPGLSRAVEKNTTDIGWLKRAFWWGMGAVSGCVLLVAGAVIGRVI